MPFFINVFRKNKFLAFLETDPLSSIQESSALYLFFLLTLRKSLIEEETKEVVEELEKDEVDMQALAKELADLLYVTYGTIVSFGLQQYMEDVFDEVHASNMSKLGRDGKPIHREDGKALKGPDYFKADMTKIFE